MSASVPFDGQYSSDDDSVRAQYIENVRSELYDNVAEATFNGAEGQNEAVGHEVIFIFWGSETFSHSSFLGRLL